MYMRIALLTATLAFSLSLHAGTPPKKVATNAPKQTSPKPSRQNTIQTTSFQSGSVNTGSNTTSGGATGKSTTGPANVGGGSKTNPCAVANPPRSCAQIKPAH
jgi:hypothetical protein